MALWDLKGKYYNKPAWQVRDVSFVSRFSRFSCRFLAQFRWETDGQLLDRPARPEGKITPYASLQVRFHPLFQ